MKKFFILLFLLFLNTNFCLSAERFNIQVGSDYLITSDKNVKNIFVSNPEVLTISPFFTIFNEKNVFLIHSTQQGKTNIMILLDKESKVYEINVEGKSNKKEQSIKKDYFEIMPLDTPPIIPEMEIDLPPIKTINEGAK